MLLYNEEALGSPMGQALKVLMIYLYFECLLKATRKTRKAREG